MANYLANYRKKLEALARKKHDLRRLVQRGGTDQQIAMAAEAVRESQVRALEAKLAQIPACEANDDRIRGLQADIELCRSRPVGDIIASC
jgi:hypothetical protein